MTNRMATVTASLTLAGRLPWDFRPEARGDRGDPGDRGARSVRAVSCGPVCVPLWPRARVLVPSALVLPMRVLPVPVVSVLERSVLAGTALTAATAADPIPRRPPAAASWPPASGTGRAGGTAGREGPASGLAGAVQTPVARPSPSACQVWVEVTSAAGSLTASIE